MPELIGLAGHCLAREPEDRPRTASIVAEQVGGYLAGVQKRLRAAELARAAETARAEEATRTAAEADQRARAERRARRFQVSLAAAVLMLTTTGGLAFTYVLQQRQARAARLDQVLAETTSLLRRAQGDADEPGPWRDALAALGRVEGQGTEPRIDTLRGQIQDGLDQAERIAKLRRELVEIRANLFDVGAEGTDSAYATAFHAPGLDLDALDPAEFARRLRNHPEAVVIELSSFLDHWSSVRRDSGRAVADWRRPLEAARLADPDAYRNRLRKVLLTEDRKAESDTLKAMASAPEAAELPPATAVLLGNALVNSGQPEAAAALLRTTVDRHPGDTFINFSLAIALKSLNPPSREEAVRYYTVARALRPEMAHDLAHLLEEIGRDGEAETLFRDLVNRRPGNARHIGCLGSHLKKKGRAAEAQAMFDRAITAGRESIRLNPNDARPHFSVGLALSDQGKLDEAIAEYRTYTRLRPDDPEGHRNLGVALEAQGKLDDAIAEYRTYIRLKPDEAEAHCAIGEALRRQGRLDEAIAEFRTAARLKPDYGEVQFNLGIVLLQQNKLDDSIAELHTAIRLKPDDAQAHLWLGIAFREQDKLDDSIAECRTAIRLKVELVDAHIALGVALRRQGRLDDAIAEFHTAIRLKPGDGIAHDELGVALQLQGKNDDASAEYRTAIRLNSELAGPHYQLGLALQRQGKLDDAIAEYRAAIRIKPDHAEAHCNLGILLRGEGKYDEALAELRKGHELGSMRRDWRYPSAQWVQEAERIAALVGRLTALVKGDDRPRDNTELLALARLCYDTKRHAAAARFWAEAVVSDPRLAEDRQAQHRYEGACAAALAAAGAGKDEPSVDDSARAKLRAQAMEWLKAELAAWSRVLDAGSPKEKEMVAQTLAHWKVDADLAGIRDPEALSKLPEAEQKSWRALWADVEGLFTRALSRTPRDASRLRPGI